MRSKILAAAVLGTMFGSLPALANEEVQKLSTDPNNWAQQSGDHALTRYSKLDQINTSNVKDLKVAWTFSTGVLRGHEGSPLVIGSTLYVHTPFPNTVFALNLDDEQKILWSYTPKQDPSVIPIMCCDTVNRGVAYADGKIFLYQADTNLVALDAKTGTEVWKTLNGNVKRGETGTSAPVVAKDKVIVGISGAEFGVQGYLTAYNIKDGKKAWRAYSIGPDDQILFDRREDQVARQAGRQGQLAQDLDRRSMEDRRRHDVGLVLVRSQAQPRLLRHRQPLDLEPGAARGTGRQADRSEVVALHHRAQCRHRRRRLGLSAHAVRRVGL